jgi:bifunctional N-acetylglucosamine-1-phosphate-uridyltransferase/glucosamine-1-phosphate-acetyltransferase GlmU-like protein
MRFADPTPFGRLILALNGTLERIVEATDANAAERAIGLVNGDHGHRSAPRARPRRRAQL